MNKKNSNLIKYIITAVVLIAFLLLNLFGSVKAEVKDEDLVINSLFKAETIKITTIDEIRLIDKFAYGSRVGISTFKINSGTFTNETYGKYSLMVYKSVNDHILIRYDDKIIVFNLESETATQALYQELLALID